LPPARFLPSPVKKDAAAVAEIKPVVILSPSTAGVTVPVKR